MNKCKITEEQVSKRKRVEELSNEISKKSSTIQNLEANKGNKEKKIKKKMADAQALLDQHDWIKDKEIDLENEPDENTLSSRRDLRNHYLSENNNLKKKINKRVEVVADELEEE